MAQTLLVTGANGNLGTKLIDAQLGTDVSAVVALDRDFANSRLPDDPRVRRIEGDLRDPAGSWTKALDGIDAVVHLAAQNPYPDASWNDCARSADMTFALVDAAVRHGVGRFVFASSNHVMGGYKDVPAVWQPGHLTTDLPPRPGTRWSAGGIMHDSPAYAVAKLMGERLLATRAATSTLTAVSLRIGWCQPGTNDPRTINASGVPGDENVPADLEDAKNLNWFRHMWLSDRDFCGACAAALRADSAPWPTRAIVVNAMSGNRTMPWDIETTGRLIGYRPQDDIWAALGVEPPDIGFQASLL